MPIRLGVCVCIYLKYGLECEGGLMMWCLDDDDDDGTEKISREDCFGSISLPLFLCMCVRVLSFYDLMQIARLLCWNELRFNRKFMRVNTLTPMFWYGVRAVCYSIQMLLCHTHNTGSILNSGWGGGRWNRILSTPHHPIVIHSSWNDHVNLKHHSTDAQCIRLACPTYGPGKSFIFTHSVHSLVVDLAPPFLRSHIHLSYRARTVHKIEPTSFERAHK